MTVHRLEHQEDGQWWCEICRDVFKTKKAHDSYLAEHQTFQRIKKQAAPRPSAPKGGYTPERRKALISFIATIDEMMDEFEAKDEKHLLDVHAVDFAELERTVREQPELLKLAVDVVINQQWMAQKALSVGEARFVPNAYLIATIYCLQQIEKLRGWKGGSDGR